MKVTLIDYTGIGHSDPLYAARLLVYAKNTRLEQGEETRQRVAAMPVDELQKELDYIANTLRSSWEFVEYTFEIKDVTRAFTHQLVRTRTGSYAQQAQRVVDMSSFSYETPVAIAADPKAKEAWDGCMAVIAKHYYHFSKAGFAKQDCRGLLPTNVHTNIIARFNLRTLADLVGKRDNPRAQGEYTDVVHGMRDEMLAVHPWVRPFLYPERTATPKLDKLIRGLLGDKSPVDCPELNDVMKEIDKLKGVWG